MLAAAGALVSALATLSCCLPFGFLAALGAAGAAVYLRSVGPWLLLLAVGLLGVGFYQVRSGLRCGVRQSKLGLVLLAFATLIVLLVALFPQVIAGVLADLGGKSGQ